MTRPSSRFPRWPLHLGGWALTAATVYGLATGEIQSAATAAYQREYTDKEYADLIGMALMVATCVGTGAMLRCVLKRESEQHEAAQIALNRRLDDQLLRVKMAQAGLTLGETKPPAPPPPKIGKPIADLIAAMGKPERWRLILNQTLRLTTDAAGKPLPNTAPNVTVRIAGEIVGYHTTVKVDQHKVFLSDGERAAVTEAAVALRTKLTPPQAKIIEDLTAVVVGPKQAQQQAKVVELPKTGWEDRLLKAMWTAPAYGYHWEGEGSWRDYGFFDKLVHTPYPAPIAHGFTHTETGRTSAGGSPNVAAPPKPADAKLVSKTRDDWATAIVKEMDANIVAGLAAFAAPAPKPADKPKPKPETQKAPAGSWHTEISDQTANMLEKLRKISEALAATDAGKTKVKRDFSDFDLAYYGKSRLMSGR